ncbi:MAG: prepilin-type N-terminal cleavage/methylation domain-containing protein [Deltaproteobacteria bacterium]
MDRQNQGFTLIELMIAIAIIGILAIVLIPKAGGIKAQAKISGIDTNIRVAAAKAEIVLANQGINQIDEVESSLANILNTNDKTKDMKNPMTGATGCIDLNVTPMTDSTAFAYFSDDEEEGYSMYEEIGENEDFAGIILYDVYLDSENKLAIKFVPLDDRGSPMVNKVVAVNQ